MIKLVLVLAVVVVVILVVVIVAVRNMRREDPDEFADQRDGRGRTRGGQDDRDLPYRGSESAGRRPARAGRNAAAAGGQAAARSAARRQGSGPRSAGSGRGSDERRDQSPGRGYRRAPDAADGYDADPGFDQRGGPPSDDRRSAPAASGPHKRRRPDDTLHSPDGPAPARTRRRSGDSAEWDSSEWEQLSDVDYWTELASSKPMTSGTQPKPSRPAAHRGGSAAGPGQEPETMAVRSQAPAGAPRRDPVTGLPIRGPQPADAELTAAAGRSDFAAAPVPDEPQDRRRPAAASNGDRGSKHHRRPAASHNGDRGPAGRQMPPAVPASDRGQRFLDAPGRDPGRYLDVGPASLPMPAIRDVPPGRPAPPAIRDVPPAPAARQARPRDIAATPPPAAAPPAVPPPAAQAPPSRGQRPVPIDDDPLTSPSFPAIKTSDSRSYRNGRADTPPGGSRAPAPYPAATPQRPSYDSPTAQYPAAQYPTAQYPEAQYPAPQYQEAQYPEAQYPEAQYPTAQYATPPTAQPPAPHRSGQHSAPHNPAPQSPAPQRPAAEEPVRGRRAAERPAAQHSAPQYARDDGGAYRPDPLPNRNPYPAPVANASPGPAAAQPARSPVTPASGNPYGSYVTPDSHQAPPSGYNGYPAAPGNGHGQPYPPPAAPAGIGQNGNGYWHQAAPVSGSLPAPEGSGYLGDPAQAGQPPHAGVPEPDYRNGYGQHNPAGYPLDGYPAAPENPAGYAPVDPYGSDGYGGYTEYGAAER
jgi:hypothetical protein